MKSSALTKIAKQQRYVNRVQWLRSHLNGPSDEDETTIDYSALFDEKGLICVDFPTFCRHFFVVTEHGEVPFKLYDWQIKAAEILLANQRRTIAILSSRQVGKTLLLAAILMYLGMRQRRFKGLLIHRSGADYQDISRDCRFFIPPGVRLEPDNLSLIGFSHTGSRVEFRSSDHTKQQGHERAGRGQRSISYVVIEEASHTQNLDNVMKIVGPATKRGFPGTKVLVGTAGSKQSRFYEHLSASANGEHNLEKILDGIRSGHLAPFQVLEGETGEISIISNWRAIPEYRTVTDDIPDGKAFLRELKKDLTLTDEQIDSEYELVFGSSADSAVFDYGLIYKAKDPTLKFYRPAEGAVVFMGVDPAGVGKDYTCAISLHRVTQKDGSHLYTVCQVYRQQTGVSEQHLNAINRLIQKLDPIAVTIEKNAMGQVWLEHLAGICRGNRVEGFATTESSKQVLIGRLQIALEREVLKIPEGIIINELLAYRRTDKGKLEAAGNAHDDTVIALALALHAAGFNLEVNV